MSCCENNNRKFNCGIKTPAICVYYKGFIPEYSELKNEDCVTIEETTDELYHNQEFILQSIDLSTLQNNDCIDYPTIEINNEEKILVVDALKTLETEICNLKNNSETGECSCIEISKLDLKCLTDEPCANPTNMTNILQMMIDKICEMNNLIQTL